METCELIDKCGFLIRYSPSNQLACQGFINRYCNGELKDQCKRKAFKMKNGTPPPDNMLPTGTFLSSSN
jgi:hypothetical protein